MSGAEIELGSELRLDFCKLQHYFGVPGRHSEACIPVCIQDRNSLEVLIIAYLNRQAFEQSVETRIVTLWSTSRDELWVKGRDSGNQLLIEEIRVNCEQNSLLFLVTKALGGACHTKDAANKPRSGCYYRRLNDQMQLEMLD